MNKILLLFFLVCLSLNGQSNKEELKTYTFSEVEKLQLQNKKPILIFTYTDWCKICFGMKKNTFKNNNVINILNEHFYFIKLNVEEKKDIHFLGNKFVYKPSGTKTGTHELAIALASINKKISYPTTIILDKKFRIEIQIDSYINSETLIKLLKKYTLN